VAEALQGDESHSLGELILFMSKEVEIHAEPLYGQEQFDVIMI
jgi:ribonuclease G